MGLEKEFGLFKQKGPTGLISGRKRTSGLSFIVKPLTSTIKRKGKKKLKSFFQRKTKEFFEKTPREPTTTEILRMEAKAIRKRRMLR